jgi:hypothetical protein
METVAATPKKYLIPRFAGGYQAKPVFMGHSADFPLIAALSQFVIKTRLVLAEVGVTFNA